MKTWKISIVTVGSALTLAACGGGRNGAQRPETVLTVKGNATAAVTPTTVSNVVTDPTRLAGSPLRHDGQSRPVDRVDWQDPNVAHRDLR